MRLLGRVTKLLETWTPDAHGSELIEALMPAAWISQLRCAPQRPLQWLAKIAVAAQARYQKAAKAAEAAQSKSWRQWAVAALSGSARSAYRMLKNGTVLPDEQVVYQGISTADPNAVSQAKADKWGALWDRWRHRFDELSSECAQLWQSAPAVHDPISAQQLTDAIRALPAEGGVGTDCLHYSFLKRLPAQAVSALASTASQMLARSVLPVATAPCAIVLIPKPLGGGDRPIALAGMLYRLAMSVKRPQLTQWDSQVAHTEDWAMPQRGAERAIAHSELRTEIAHFKGLVSGGALVDMETFYDNVPLSTLIAHAAHSTYPPHLFRLSLALCLAPRYIRYAGTWSLEVAPAGGLLAGDPQATSLARLLLLPAVRVWRSWYPRFSIRTYVDDITVQVADTPTALRDLVPNALELLDRELRAVGCIPGSKTTVLASRPAVARMIAGRLARKGLDWPAAVRGRDLGGDTTFGGRRTTRVQQGRLLKAGRRAAKAGILARMSKQARVLYKPGIASVALSGSTAGIAPTVLRRHRGATVAGTGLTKRGICSTTAFRLTLARHSDPLVAHPIRQFRLWTDLLHAHPDTRAELGHVWSRVVARVSVPSRWRRVRGPATAFAARVLDMGWTPHTPLRAGVSFGVVATFSPAQWQHTHSRLLEALERACWGPAAAHPDGGGLQQGAVLDPARAFVEKLRRAGDRASAGLLEVAVAGGWWPESRRHSAGYRVSPTCQRCHSQPETLQHAIWLCPANAAITHPAVLATQELIPRATAPDAVACLWQRAIVARSSLPPIPPPPLAVCVPLVPFLRVLSLTWCLALTAAEARTATVLSSAGVDGAGLPSTLFRCVMLGASGALYPGHCSLCLALSTLRSVSWHPFWLLSVKAVNLTPAVSCCPPPPPSTRSCLPRCLPCSLSVFRWTPPAPCPLPAATFPAPLPLPRLASRRLRFRLARWAVEG